MTTRPALASVSRALASMISVAAVLALLTACKEKINVKEQLQLEDVTTGWYDAGVVEGKKNKLVPTISFRLRNKGPQEIGLVQINAVYRRVGEDEEWGSQFIRAVTGNGLPPGEATSAIVLRADNGYTGEQPRSEMLSHSQFQDAHVEVFAKHKSDDYVKLGDIPIKRQLLTR